MSAKGLFQTSFLSLSILVLIAACSKSDHSAGRLFYGECKVSVQAEPEDAEIVIDGIPVGHKRANVEIPCGEKQILVEKHGFRPYYQYLKVVRESPLHVKVALQKLEKIEDYALSRELIEQVRNGKRMKNPFVESDAKDSKEEAEEESAPVALDLGLGDAGGAASAGGGSLPPGDINSVDYWR